MKIVDAPKSDNIYAYNVQHDYTRRLPTFRTKKQEERDSRIALAIGRAYDNGDQDRCLEIFFQKHKLLSDPIYWEVLRAVWVGCGSTELANKFRPLFRANRRAKSWFMTPEDTEALEHMTFPIQLWRAYDDEDDPGISWTSDKEWCEKYAKTRGRKIKSIMAEREDIYAYVSRRGENEFIIL